MYNRIAVAIPNESTLADLKSKGYPLAVNVNEEHSALVTNPGGTQTGAQVWMGGFVFIINGIIIRW